MGLAIGLPLECCMVWYGTVWYGSMVWYGVVWIASSVKSYEIYP